MNYRFIKKIPFIVLITLLVTGCGGQSEPQTEEHTTEVDSAASAESQERLEKARNLFYSFPSPVETAELIKSSGATFDKSVLNGTEKTSKYSSNKDKALNLGIYGADLCFANAFDQQQEVLSYMKAANQLSANLGISSAFGEDIGPRMEKNKGNKDSLMMIISDAFLTADMYLKSNDRVSLSALIIAGGWIEGLYVSSQLVQKTKNNKELLQRIADQRKAGVRLLKLFDAFGTDEDIADVRKKIESLNDVFATIQPPKQEMKTTEDGSGVLTLGTGAPKPELTLEKLKPVINKVIEIRNSITM